MSFIKDLGPRHSTSHAQPHPGFDTAFTFASSIVVDQTMKPRSTYFADWAVRDNCCIFDRNAFLIIKAVGNPDSDFCSGRFTCVHRQVKGMLVVITLRAHGP